MSLPTRTNRTPDEEQVLKHVIAEYKHRAQTVTCVCGWHGSTLTRGSSSRGRAASRRSCGSSRGSRRPPEPGRATIRATRPAMHANSAPREKLR